jgi:uncharacterized protein YidB (DUF937 family)
MLYKHRTINLSQESTMSMLDGVLGGLVSAGVTNFIGKVVEEHGGVQGIISQFEKGGLGSVVQSWVGTGANQPVTAQQIHSVLGADTIKALAAKLNMPAEELAAKIAEVLPTTIDKLTPNGTLPAIAA